MRKIIFLGTPAYGHVYPALPVVEELVRRGEQVLFYNTEEFRSLIEQTGARFHPYVGTGMDSTGISALIQDGNLARVTVLLLGETENILPSLLEELDCEQPDLVIFDSLAMWGKIASTLLNLRTVGLVPHFISDEKLLLQQAPRAFLQALRGLPQVPAIIAGRSRIIKRYGAAAFPTTSPMFPMRGGLNIIFTSRDLHLDSPILDDTFRFVGPSINQRVYEEEFPIDLIGQGPVVYISLGTLHNNRIEFYQQCFEAFGDTPAQFLLSIGKQTNVEMLVTIPSNFIVRSSFPQLEVLKHADVFITHGGMNSIHEGLYYGVPLVLIPFQLEQLFGALSVTKTGAGYLIDDQVTRGRIPTQKLAQALKAVMSEASYRQAAGEVQKSLQASGGYHQAADEIIAFLEN